MKKFYTLLAFLCGFNLSYSQYKYLGSYTSDGTPLYLVTSDVISSNTMTLLHNALPEGYPVPVYNPQYISSGYDTDIILTDSADVWVTFVDEGAGYKNVLGFYTYNINSPLTSAPASSAVTIIFPNVSKMGSGGSLVAGNKVKIGSFPANTGIGFMLIADGWRNGAVTNGNWKVFSNPDFNPESNSALRAHNALISDSTNQIVVLGFEDIRRDYASCDNDFNDALFYISASPYTAIQTYNFASIEGANTAVTSANKGGLESNGRLAQKIAKRFFEIQKSNGGTEAVKKYQKPFKKYLSRPLGIDSAAGPLSGYLPLTGMFGTEQPFVSTPNDLLKITNATEVFSADYYIDTQRVSAALATRTSGKVYDHTKAICDRLNNATLEDVRTISLGNYKLINSTLTNADGETEFCITFSVQVQPGEYKLYSFWNVEQYPKGEYLNFQVWGRSMGQVCSITNEILKKLQREKPVSNNAALTLVPKVFVKKGSYRNGKLYLTICNKQKLSNITLTGNSTNTETGSLSPFTKDISLTGNFTQDVEVNTGAIFDIGFAITYPNNLQMDGLYLADGAWGIDYDSQQASDINFTVANDFSVINHNKLNIERNPELHGKIKGTVNLFRNAKAGNLPLDISAFTQLSFDIQSNTKVEVILVGSDLNNWADRARYTIPPSLAAKRVNIPLSKFTDANGNLVKLNKIKTIVFSINGNYDSYSNFNLKVSNADFNNEVIIEIIELDNPKVYPNPFAINATIIFPKDVKSGTLQISNGTGKLVISQEITVHNNEYPLAVKNLQTGIYFFKMLTTDNKKYKGKFMIKK